MIYCHWHICPVPKLEGWGSENAGLIVVWSGGVNLFEVAQSLQEKPIYEEGYLMHGSYFTSWLQLSIGKFLVL